MDRPVGTPGPAASHALLILGGVPDLGGAGGCEVDDDGRGRSVASPATCATERWMAGSSTTKKRHLRDNLGRTNFFSVIHMTLL